MEVNSERNRNEVKLPAINKVLFMWVSLEVR